MLKYDYPILKVGKEIILKYLKSKILQRLEEKKDLLDKKRPLPKEVLLKLREQMLIEGTYNSNAIEGNTLTLKETRLVLETGITIAGKSLREHFEATNHRDAMIFLEGLVKNKGIKENDILAIHAIILKDIEKELVGRYRHGQVRILGTRYLPPNYLKVSQLMKGLVHWTNRNPEKLHPVELASLAHYKLVAIHPFYDGNGRTARLLMNLILMQHGWPSAIVPFNERKRYFNSLEKADRGNYVLFINLMAQFIERSLDLYLVALGRLSEELPLVKLAKHTPYSVDYLSLLARQGELAATKKGKIWFSTLKSVREYQKRRERKREKI